MENRDALILTQREAFFATLATPELRAMRAQIQRAYAAYCFSGKCAAAADRAIERGGSAEAAQKQEAQALRGYAHWCALCEDYERERAARLTAAGVTDLAFAKTTTQAQAEAEATYRCNATTPAWWGRVKYPDAAARAAAWNRLTDRQRAEAHFAQRSSETKNQMPGNQA